MPFSCSNRALQILLMGPIYTSFLLRAPLRVVMTSHLSVHRQQRQVVARPSALLTSSPQQAATVRGCPVTIDASSSGSINLRLKLCAQWSDVAKVIDEFGDSLGASNVAYALYRLGCLHCFMSSQRRKGGPWPRPKHKATCCTFLSDVFKCYALALLECGT